jgi:hypothetical protein
MFKNNIKNYFLVFNNMEIQTLTKKQLWLKNNKEKIAEYARNYYHKRCERDPEYKKKLCEKERKNKEKRNNLKEVKSVGRPLKYPVKKE